MSIDHQATSQEAATAANCEILDGAAIGESRRVVRKGTHLDVEVGKVC